MRRWLKCGALALLCWTQEPWPEPYWWSAIVSAPLWLETSQGWVHLLQERLVEGDESWRVVNASISGDTTAGGLARLDPLLEEHTPEVVILELGGNDGLRGQSPVQLKQNLADMIDRSREAGAEVLLLGMRMPPNLGQRYTRAFADAFDSLAQEKSVAYVPFLLEGVGGCRDDAGRRHPSDGRGAEPVARDGLAGTRALALRRGRSYCRALDWSLRCRAQPGPFTLIDSSCRTNSTTCSPAARIDCTWRCGNWN